MNIKKTFNLAYPVFVACLVLSACASKPVLLPKSAVVPAGVDFSGLWELRVDPDSTSTSLGRVDSGIRIPPKNTTRNAGRRRSKRSTGSAVHVFLETGKSLKISQTADGLFISFDRAIVEEYRFGEDRVVSVGPIEAQRVSGWEEAVFVVETLDKEGMILTE